MCGERLVIYFFYGRDQTYLDVTSQVLEHCGDGERIYIQRGDIGRAHLFSDPVYGVVKDIVVVRDNEKGRTCHVYGDGLDVVIELSPSEKQWCYDSESGLSRQIHQIRRPPAGLPTEQKIAFIHDQLSLTGGSLLEELPEQRMTVNYLDPEARVLEIGANIGRNTLVIASILADPANLVTLECDPEAVRILQDNRSANGLNFHIEPAALSYRKLMQRGWDTVPSDELQPGCQWVQTITFEELSAKYGVNFDTLVADCEGALYYILQDNHRILGNIRMVILESDYLSADHKSTVEEIFRSYGLEKIYSEPLVATWDHPFPDECVASFFEVWERRS